MGLFLTVLLLSNPHMLNLVPRRARGSALVAVLILFWVVVDLVAPVLIGGPSVAGTSRAMLCWSRFVVRLQGRGCRVDVPPRGAGGRGV